MIKNGVSLVLLLAIGAFSLFVYKEFRSEMKRGETMLNSMKHHLQTAQDALDRALQSRDSEELSLADQVPVTARPHPVPSVPDSSRVGRPPLVEATPLAREPFGLEDASERFRRIMGTKIEEEMWYATQDARDRSGMASPGEVPPASR